MIQSASAVDSLGLILNSSEDAPPFNLMFVDQRMPEMDGLDMLSEMLKLSAQNLRPLPPAVLMVNSTALSADRPRMQEVGLRHYLFKPIRRSDLCATLSELIGERGTDASTNGIANGGFAAVVNHHAIEDARAIRILLADDSPDNRLVIRAFLQKTSYQIDEAENGERVVAKVKNNRYDLILMDIQMPILDGFAATRAIREWERAQELPPVPIIALTASALDEDVQRAREAGCNLHVSKPIKKKTLLRAIAALTSDAEAATTFSMLAL